MAGEKGLKAGRQRGNPDGQVSKVGKETEESGRELTLWTRALRTDCATRSDGRGLFGKEEDPPTKEVPGRSRWRSFG